MFGSEDMSTGALGMGSGIFAGSGAGGWGAAPMSIGGVDISTLSPMEQLQAQNIQRTWDFQDAYTANLGASAQPSKLSTALGNFGTAANGIASLANIYFGLQGMKLQKEAFKFNKGVTNTNLNNSISDYNRRLGDTLANRALNMGGGAAGDAYVSDQLAKFSAKRS